MIGPISILSICIIAFITRSTFAWSGLFMSSVRMFGVTCHQRPNLSLSHPQRDVSRLVKRLLPFDYELENEIHELAKEM